MPHMQVHAHSPSTEMSSPPGLAAGHGWGTAGDAICHPRSSQLCRASCGRGIRPCVPAGNTAAPADSCRARGGTRTTRPSQQLLFSQLG